MIPQRFGGAAARQRRAEMPMGGAYCRQLQGGGRRLRTASGGDFVGCNVERYVGLSPRGTVPRGGELAAMIGGGRNCACINGRKEGERPM